MKTHEIEVSEIGSQSELIKLMEKENIKRGDTIKLTDNNKNGLLSEAILFLVMLAIIHLFVKEKKKQEQQGNRILEKLFGGKSIDEIEKEVESEYGIKVEVEYKENTEEKGWKELSAANFIKGYSQDEPDYTEADIKEPNEEYRKWKKGK
jgi:hypothetical protein